MRKVIGLLVCIIAFCGVSYGEILIDGKEQCRVSGFVAGAINDGGSVVGRAVTHTLYVSPNGNNTSGLDWDTAYNTIQSALDSASTDGDDCTLIQIAPHTTYYDINTTGDPTWSANVILKGTHRLWAVIKNTHASATSVFKFTGKASIEDIAIFTQGSVDGVIFTKSGFRARHCGFNSENTTGANESIHVDGSASITRGGIIQTVEFIGNKTNTTAIYIDQSKVNTFAGLNIHTCLKAIQIVDADSDQNYFKDLDIGDCTTGVDIDAGNNQHFTDINFHSVTTAFDDEVDDHLYHAIHGSFPITIYPDDFSGVTLTADGSADVYGADTEVRAGATASKPFRIVGVHLNPTITQGYKVRLSADSGSTFFDEYQVNERRNRGAKAPSGTDFIFNEGTRISASVKAESGGSDTLLIWLEIQEIN